MERSEFRTGFAARLDNAIHDAGYSSRKRFALEAGMSPSMMQNYCQGSSEPTAFAIFKMAELLGVSSDHLLGLEEPEPRESSSPYFTTKNTRITKTAP